jgi:carbon starvation protein
MLQDIGKHVWAPFGRVSWYPAVVLSSVMFVGMWGWFLIAGVKDPAGGINTLWPLFGIANQLLACVALCVATTVIVKMGKARYMWVTILPLLWLGTVTMTASVYKVFGADPRLGLLTQARTLSAAVEAGNLPANVASVEAAQTLIFQARLNAGVALFFMIAVVVVIAASLKEWIAVISGRKPAVSSEVPYEPKASPAFGD